MKQMFWVGFAAIILIVAGGVSYLASGSPDGLDSATLKGCQVVETDLGEELTGDCIAQHATEHTMAGSPLADYSIVGRAGSGGVAGIIGAVVTVLIAGGTFRMIARRKSAADVSH